MNQNMLYTGLAYRIFILMLSFAMISCANVPEVVNVKPIKFYNVDKMTGELYKSGEYYSKSNHYRLSYEQ